MHENDELLTAMRDYAHASGRLAESSVRLIERLDLATDRAAESDALATAVASIDLDPGRLHSL